MKLYLTPPALKIDVDEIAGCPTCHGRARGPVVWIRRGAPHPAGILAHELAHVRQWWVGVLIGAAMAYAAWILGCPYWQAPAVLGAALHALAYRLPAYRLWSEIRATVAKIDAIQGGWEDDRLIRREAGGLAHGYDLDITTDEAVGRILRAR